MAPFGRYIRQKASAGGLEDSIPFFLSVQTAFSAGSQCRNEDISQITLSRGEAYASLQNSFHIFFADQVAGPITHRRMDSKRKLQAIAIMCIYKNNELGRPPCPKTLTRGKNRGKKK